MIIILGVMKILNKDTQSEESFNLIKKMYNINDGGASGKINVRAI